MNLVLIAAAVAFTSLPKPVQDTVHQKYPGAQIKGAETEQEKGAIEYEVKLTSGKDQLEVKLNAGGDITAVEKLIKPQALPKPVADAVKSKYPKATIARAEEITEGGKVTYELLLKEAGKPKKREVTFDSAGAFVEEEATKD